MRELPAGTVTLLFTDMEGSTRLLQRVGERYADVLEASRHLLRTACPTSITATRSIPRGMPSSWPLRARRDAVSAAVDAQRALASHAWPEGSGGACAHGAAHR